MGRIVDAIKKGLNFQGGTHSSDNWTPPNSFPLDWWQRDFPTITNEQNNTVLSCVNTISQSVAVLPVHHVRIKPDGTKEVLTNSAAAKVLRKPNPMQTQSDFMLHLVRQLLLEGNSYHVATRNKRYEIDALFPQQRLSVHIGNDHKDVFYSGRTDEWMMVKPEDLDSMVPQRDVLHIKMYTGHHPLVGISPVENAALAIKTGNVLALHSEKFFENGANPSGTLNTSMTLSPEQTATLRERWDEQSQGMQSGKTPILTNGLEYKPVTMSAVDAEIIASYKLTREDIAAIFRVPLPLLGFGESKFNNTEQLMRFFVSTSLGFIVEHIENALEATFNLPPDEKIEFDTDFLLQNSFEERMNGYKTAIMGGIMSPNEVRKKIGLQPQGEVADGLIVQMQNIPLDLAAELAVAQITSDNKIDVGTNEDKSLLKALF